MNTKVLLAGLAATVFFFFGGWLLYGMLLMDYATANTTVYEGLMKSETEMSFPGLIVSNAAWGFLLALICDKTSSKSLMAGAITGAWVGFLMMLSFDASFYAFFNLYTSTYLATDVVLGTLFMSAGGAVVGLVLGSGNKA
jgi:hypothetical protein